MSLEKQSVCCQNQNNKGNGGNNNGTPSNSAGNPKESKSDGTTYLTQLCRGMSRAIDLKDKRFQLSAKSHNSSAKGNGITIIYSVIKTNTSYDNVQTDSVDIAKNTDIFGEMWVSILPNKNRYVVTFNTNKDCHGNKEDIEQYKKCIESNVLCNTDFGTTINKFESYYGDNISTYILTKMFSKKQIAELSNKQLIEAFGTSGSGYMYTKAKALSYMQDHKPELRVISIKEPRGEIKGPRIAIRIKDQIISFTCDKIDTKVFKGFHILRNGNEI